MNIPIVSLPEAAGFVEDIAGKQTALYVLKNKNNLQAAITNYGARWVSMLVQGASGMIDIVLGFDTIAGYLRSTEAYYGATVGRYCNRIARGKFILDGKEFILAVNNPPNHLHGGIKGFHAVVWDVKNISPDSITLSYISVDGEEGYPGRLEASVKYRLTDDDVMEITFEASTDKPTVLSLTNHAYFNLNGQGSGTILAHQLEINANAYTPIDNTSIPTGIIESVDGTAFDFREGVRIGERIHEPTEQLTNGNGYDHNFVLDKAPGSYTLAASVRGDIENVKMEVFTTEPGLQLYTGNFMNNENLLKGGHTDGKHEGFCLETQHFPDTPNKPAFPPAVLRPGEMYGTKTAFRFSRG